MCPKGGRCCPGRGGTAAREAHHRRRCEHRQRRQEASAIARERVTTSAGRPTRVITAEVFVSAVEPELQDSQTVSAA